MSKRFSYIKYDERSKGDQEMFKQFFEALEGLVDKLPGSREKSLVLTHLEEAYMWVGKAIRDRQISCGQAEEQPERSNS